MIRICAAALLSLLSASAYGQQNGGVFAAVSAPKSSHWKPGERWKDESIDGKPAVRLISGTSYCSAELNGEIPESGSVMVRLRFHGGGVRPFSAGIGAWGSPVKGIVPKGAEWQTAEIAFPAASARKHLSNGRIALMIKGAGGQAGPAISKIEIYVPSEADVLKKFREYVTDSTAAAWKNARTGRFTYVDKYDNKTPLAPSAQDTRRGAIPFARHYLVPMYPASVPTKSERVLTASVQMTPGEYESVQFGIKALKGFKGCAAKVIGKLPKGLEAEIRWVECVPLRTAGGSSSKKWRVQPNRLWPSEIFPTCNVNANDAQAWWITFKSDDTLKPGRHTVKVSIADAKKKILTYAIDVRILPFTLPKKVDYAWGFYESRGVEASIVEDMAEHGCNSLSAWPSFKPFKGKAVDFTEWDRYFAMLKSKGINHSFLWYVGTKKNGWAVKKSVGADSFGKALEGINERVKDGRYPPTFAVTIDEAVTNRTFNELKQLFSMMKQKSPDLTPFGVSLNRHNYAKRHEGLIKVLSCNGSFDQNSKWCRKNGYGMYTYTVFSGRSSAHSARYNCGFNPWRYQATGTFGWALRWYNGNPYNDMDGGMSDWGIILPNWTGRPIATPAWEGWREGVDDRRYIEVYSALVKKGKAPAKLLDDVRALLKEDQLSNEEKVGDSIFEALLNDALKLKRARERLIEGILKAQ